MERAYYLSYVYAVLQLTVPGPPFVFGGFVVIVAMMVAIFMPMTPRIIIVHDVTKCDAPVELADRPTVSSEFLGNLQLAVSSMCGVLSYRELSVSLGMALAPKFLWTDCGTATLRTFILTFYECVG